MALMSGGAIQQNWRLDARVGGDRAGPGCCAPTRRRRSPTAARAPTSFCSFAPPSPPGSRCPSRCICARTEAVIGTPFFVMRRVEGIAAAHRMVRSQTLGGGRERLVASLGRELAAIHAIRPPREDLAFLPPPAPRPVGTVRARHAPRISTTAACHGRCSNGDCATWSARSPLSRARSCCATTISAPATYMATECGPDRGAGLGVRGLGRLATRISAGSAPAAGASAAAGRGGRHRARARPCIAAYAAASGIARSIRSASRGGRSRRRSAGRSSPSPRPNAMSRAPSQAWSWR